jgi:natural product biosynthesis luciferase-like monooxygenase protein
MEFGLMFFSSGGAGTGPDKYALLLEAARFADRHGFCSVWTPERHFHEFGGLFPSPAVLSAALAMVTDHLQIRAGSLISPLHHALRIAEEWSVVDNLSAGRVAVSFGSGWNVDDFLFFPERYESRHAVMYSQIDTVRRLWRGEPVVQENSFGRPVAATLFPRPVQSQLPIWITSSGNAETFASAGACGANLLTHLLGQDLAALATKIERYRAALHDHHGAQASGRVTLMLHTFLGEDAEAVKARVRGPLREYLRSAVGLEQLAAAGGGVISGGHRIDPHAIPPAALEELLDIAFERYFSGASLLGTPAGCEPLVWRLEEIGVDEIACLIDFIADRQAVLEALPYIAQLQTRCRHAAEAATAAVHGFLGDLEG